MSSKTPLYSYALAVCLSLGIVFLVTPLLREDSLSGWLRALVVLGLLYALTGTGIAYVWSEKGWRWGLCLSAPLWALTIFSVIFASFGSRFLTRDVSVLLAVLISACAGAYLGATLKRRFAPNIRL